MRKPALREFQNIARAAGVPEPNSWERFYDLTFDGQTVDDGDTSA